jgi:hypothetical protein
MSHVWWPPVQRFPAIPQFEPQILWNRVLQILQITEPYREAFKFVEEVIKWKRDPLVCIEAFLIFTLHIAVLPHLLPLLHVYIFIFIFRRLRNAHEHNNPTAEENTNPKPLIREDSHTDLQIYRSSKTSIDKMNEEDYFPSSPSAERLNERFHVEQSENANNHINRSDGDEDDAAKLNVAVSWVAKRFLDNKGLEVLQFDLGCLARDLKNLTMVWDGSHPVYSKMAMVVISISFMLHIYFNRRLIWMIGIFSWYFAQSPLTILLARMVLGIWRGIAKVMRRREIYDTEVIELVKKAQ